MNRISIANDHSFQAIVLPDNCLSMNRLLISGLRIKILITSIVLMSENLSLLCMAQMIIHHHGNLYALKHLC